MADKHLLIVDNMPTDEEFMSDTWRNRLDYVGLVKNVGGIDTKEVFYNFDFTKITDPNVTILKVKIEEPGNYGLGYIDGDITSKNPVIINWGNGTTTTLQTPITSSEEANDSTDYYTYYSEPGNYIIYIDGPYDNFKCYDNDIKKSNVTQINNILTEIIKVSSFITNFNFTFFNCKRLIRIPDNLFDNNTSVTDFYGTFQNCSNLTTIPSGLFDNNTNVTDFYGTFSGCSNLKSIPSGLFDKNIKVTGFSYTFSGCSSLTTIPSGLFDNNTNVTDFSGTFFGCSSLTTIQSSLFDNNTNVASFYRTFSDCSSLKSMPSGLFDNNRYVMTFNETFYNCSNLTTIPSGLFDKNINVTDFSKTFYNCSNLTGETPYALSSDGKKIKLWDRDGTNGFTKPTKVTNAFYNCNQLTDYEDIPDDWK